MGTIKDNFVNVARNRLGQVLLQKKNEVAQLYGARATPTAVMVNTDGRIASRVAGGSEEIRALLQSFVQDSNGVVSLTLRIGRTHLRSRESNIVMRFNKTGLVGKLKLRMVLWCLDQIVQSTTFRLLGSDNSKLKLVL